MVLLFHINMGRLSKMIIYSLAHVIPASKIMIVGEIVDGKGFVAKIEDELVPISPIIGFAIKKQLADLGTTPQDLTPMEAMKFVGSMTDALELFLGKAESQKKRKFMISLLRKYAPEYFEERSLI